MRSATVSLVMLLALAPATALTGCASEDDRAPAGALRHWRAEAPPLPPPDPAAYPQADASRVPGPTARPKTPRAAPEHSAGSATEPRTTAAPSDPHAAGAPSDEEVARELREALGAGRDTSARSLVERATLTSDGLATVPPGAPARVAAIIRGANEVARKPYVYGGGHGRLAGETWIDSAYDCSGSVSFALANAGLVDTPMVSGALASWGDPGPGTWVTIYANGGHAFMTVAGLRFDTSGRQVTGTRWQQATRTVAGFTVRHPAGL